MGENLFNFFIMSIVSSLVLLSSVVALNPKKAGFTLRIIHRDSKESPLYPGDHVTREERFQRLVQQSKDRLRYVDSQIILQSNATSSVNPNSKMHVVYEGQMWYVAEVLLGRFNEIPRFKHYYLMVDSGSDITWLQCEGAEPKFYQDDPLYPYRLSSSFSPIPCITHPDCMGGNACDPDGHCTYHQTYAGESTTSGLLAFENFNVISNGVLVEFALYLGCGFRQENFDHFGKNHMKHKPDLIAGILGLGAGPWSFLNQLGSVGQGKFSHCLEKFDDSTFHGLDTFMRFGEDATIGGGGQEVHKTPIVVPGFPTSNYYLILEDVSVADMNVGFVREDFELKSGGRGGSIIDSGIPWSYMYKDHFEDVARLVMQHFARHAILPIQPALGDFPLCFHIPPEWDDPVAANYPSITFHFQEDAKFVVSGIGSAFLQNPSGPEHGVCLGIGILDHPNMPSFILGALQQTNKKVLYNLMDRYIAFSDQDCQQDQ